MKCEHEWTPDTFSPNFERCTKCESTKIKDDPDSIMSPMDKVFMQGYYKGSTDGLCGAMLADERLKEFQERMNGYTK